MFHFRVSEFCIFIFIIIIIRYSHYGKIRTSVWVVLIVACTHFN